MTKSGDPAPAILVESVRHRYGRTDALAGASLVVPTGSTTALVGPDGVGKSTLLGVVAGTRRLQAGVVEVFGGPIASAAHRLALTTRIAFVPQGLGRSLYPTLSVVENIEFFARLQGLPAAARRARIDRLLRATGLEPFPDRAAGKLSGGMRQKLSLCCALVHDPELLLLDEPTTGIDPLSRNQFWSLIDALRAERPGLTVVVATAAMDEAERFERLAIMDGGRVLAAGPIADVLARAGAARVDEAFAALRDGGRGKRPAAAPIPPRPARSHAIAIRAEGLTRRFGSFTAVDRASFEIERGEIFGFLGSNGCGKTTTMKMLTGLLPSDEGTASILGRPVDATDVTTRLRVGYMSQGFSLYEELTVRENLVLHAHLYRLPRRAIPARIDDALGRFDLVDVADRPPLDLPLGLRQRLQLAVACLHAPEVLILDEPTSGVDPVARDLFWQLLGDLSRNDGVTIFVSTHFMNEAARCDRVSLMHAGRVLAVGTPEALCRARDAPDLEAAFIGYLEDAEGGARAAVPMILPPPRRPSPRTRPLADSVRRFWAVGHRELREVLRDPIRVAFALIGPLVVLLALGYGISFDVEGLPFAVLDRDRSIESRRLVDAFTASRYLETRPPLADETAIDRRLRAGELRLTVELPAGFGRDLLRGHRPELGVIVDGAPTFRAENARSYVAGIVAGHIQDLARREGIATKPAAARIEPRFRYNQDFRSLRAIAPGSIMVLLVLFPAMLTALGIVRERETGSIGNLYASPATLGEYLLGKQVPYLLLGTASFGLLLALTVLLFDVPVGGSLAALVLGAVLYLFAATALGILVSSFVRTQVAAIIVTAIISVVPAVNFSGYLYPAATLEGPAWYIGHAFPSLWFQTISIGTFAKARAFADFRLEYVVLFGYGALYLVLTRLLLRKQEA